MAVKIGTQDHAPSSPYRLDGVDSSTKEHSEGAIWIIYWLKLFLIGLGGFLPVLGQ